MSLWDWSGPQSLDWASAQRSFANVAALELVQPRYKHEIVVALDTGIKYQGDQPVLGGWVLATGAPSGIPTGGYPSVSRTGPAAGTVFTESTGNFQSTSIGQVIENRQINNGLLDIRHSGVIVRDCIINSQDAVAMLTTGAGPFPNCIIERCRFTGIGGNTALFTDAMTGVEIRYCDISGYENGIAIGANAMYIHDNYIHDLFSLAGDPHIDGIQGTGGFTSLRIEHNTIISSDTSCIILQNEGAAFSGAIVNNNRLVMIDGAYCCLIQDKDDGVGAVSNITVTNNRMDKGPTIGAHYGFFHNVLALTWTNNVDDVTSVEVNPDIG